MCLLDALVLGAAILEPNFNLRLCQVQRLGQLKPPGSGAGSGEGRGGSVVRTVVIVVVVAVVAVVYIL